MRNETYAAVKFVFDHMGHAKSRVYVHAAYKLGQQSSNMWIYFSRKQGESSASLTCGCTPSSSISGVFTTAPPRPNMPAITPARLQMAGKMMLL